MFQIDIQDKIAHLRFNRPEKANALHQAGWEAMKTHFQALSKNPQVRVVVLSGEGKHFCSGIDLELLLSFAQLNEMGCEGRKREALLAIIQHLQECVNAIEYCKKPVIAAIQGACIGGGLDIAAACDMRFCAADAYFSIREVDMGMVADLGTLQRLPKIIPYGKVTEMAFTGRQVLSGEAQHIGLVNQVYPDTKTLHEQVYHLAKEIAAKSPLVVRGTKNALLYARDHAVAEGLSQIQYWNAATLLSDDLMQAIKASVSKQKPQFDD